MKTGLVTSVALHAALIGIGLVSLPAPKAFETADVEALPVDIVPIGAITQMQAGDSAAEPADTPAPQPTERSDTVEDARTVGDNDVDLDTPPTPNESPRPVESAAAPPPEPEPAPEPDPAPEPEPAPAPAPQAEAEPAPPQPAPEPDPVAETIAEEAEPEPQPEPEPERVALPDSAPVPQTRPEPPRPRPQQTADSDSAFDEDQIAALLNQEDDAGGGAQRSRQQAALGGERTTAEQLSQGEMEALRSQLSGCWNIPIGAEGADGLRASVEFSVGSDGRIDGMPRVVSSSGHRQFDESAVRAIQKCDQQGLRLPAGKAEVWSRIVVNFDPSEMF